MYARLLKILKMFAKEVKSLRFRSSSRATEFNTLKELCELTGTFRAPMSLEKGYGD